MFRWIGIAPLGVGLTVMAFLWGSPWNEFHSPPLFFRIFGTFVAIPFVLFGGAILLGRTESAADRMEILQDELERRGMDPNSAPAAPATGPSRGKLKCPNCGSSPGAAEVSPHGDVKCDHCSRWYNVHTA